MTECACLPMPTIILQYRNDGFQSLSGQLRSVQDKTKKNNMPLIKSLFTTRYSQIDDEDNRIENHDAVIEVAIKDTRRAFAQAKIHPGKVDNVGQ